MVIWETGNLHIMTIHFEDSLRTTSTIYISKYAAIMVTAEINHCTNFVFSDRYEYTLILNVIIGLIHLFKCPKFEFNISKRLPKMDPFSSVATFGAVLYRYVIVDNIVISENTENKIRRIRLDPQSSFLLTYKITTENTTLLKNIPVPISMLTHFLHKICSSFSIRVSGGMGIHSASLSK